MDRRIDPVGSTLLASFPWSKGISLLGCVIEKGLDPVCGGAYVPVTVCY